MPCLQQSEMCIKLVDVKMHEEQQWEEDEDEDEEDEEVEWRNVPLGEAVSV